MTSMSGTPIDPLAHEFISYVHGAYLANGPVFAVILARLLLFAEAEPVFARTSESARSQVAGLWARMSTLMPEERSLEGLLDFYQRSQQLLERIEQTALLVDRAAGERTLFQTPALDILKRPWPHGTCRDLLARMEQDVSLAGNSYTYLASPDRLQRLRPDWVSVVLQDGEKAGFLYWPGGKSSGTKPDPLTLDEVAHYCPIPDPLSPWKGMSWLTPIVAEIESDKQQTRHKQKFFENAATPNLLVTVEKKIKDKDARDTFRNEIDQRYGGLDNAYRTMILDDGADAKVIGQSFEEITFAAIQAAGENRIASAAGVPSIVVGFKEGLQAATYSNYGQAMRRFAELTMHPHWGFAFGDLATIVTVPTGADLWYDPSRIPALQQDAKDAAEILQLKANVAGQLIRSGYDPKAVGPAIGLPVIPHTGKVPVTLYPDGDNPAKTAPKQAPEDQGSEGKA